MKWPMKSSSSLHLDILKSAQDLTFYRVPFQAMTCKSRGLESLTLNPELRSFLRHLNEKYPGQCKQHKHETIAMGANILPWPNKICFSALYRVYMANCVVGRMNRNYLLLSLFRMLWGTFRTFVFGQMITIWIGSVTSHAYLLSLVKYVFQFL